MRFSQGHQYGQKEENRSPNTQVSATAMRPAWGCNYLATYSCKHISSCGLLTGFAPCDTLFVHLIHSLLLFLTDL